MAIVTALGFSIFSRFDDKGFRRAQRALQGLNNVDTSNFGKSFAKSMQQIDDSNKRTAVGFGLHKQAVYALIAAAGSAIAPLATATVALGAFGAVAAPSIIRVVTASMHMGEQFDRLSKQEQVSATLTRTLATNYRALSKQFESRALSAFNGFIGDTNALLPQLGGFVNKTAGNVSFLLNRLGEFTQQRIGGEFLTWAGKAAPEALDVAGSSIFALSDSVLTLVQDLEPLGLVLLRSTNGVLGMANAVAKAHPGLLQLAVGTVLLRAPMTKMASTLASASTGWKAFSKANANAGFATKALNLVLMAGAPILIAAGAAVGFFALKMLMARDPVDRLAHSMKMQREAVGNSLPVYQRQADVLRNKVVTAVNELRSSLQGDIGSGDTGVGTSVKRLREEAEKAQTRLNTLTGNADSLGRQFSITRDQALRLADAAGVNLALNVDRSGRLTAAATQKINDYAAAVQLAAQPTRQIALAMADVSNQGLTLKDRLTSLKNAFDAQLTPMIESFVAITKMREGMRDLGDALNAGKGSFNGWNEASLKLRKAFSDAVTNARELYTATLQQTQSQTRAADATNKYIPVLYALAGGNREAKATVDALARITGFQISQTEVSRRKFIQMAMAMLGNKKQAEALWVAYKNLQEKTGGTTSTTGQMIVKVRSMATSLSLAAQMSGHASSKQNIFNDTVRKALPVLYALAGRNKSARAQVDALAQSLGVTTGKTNTSKRAFMDMSSKMGIARDRAEKLWKELLKIRSRDVHVNAKGTALWTGPAGNRGPLRGAAKGGAIEATWPGATKTKDSQPILAQPGEHMWTQREVSAVGGHSAMYRLRAAAARGELRGYAGGGAITTRRGSANFTNDRGSAAAVAHKWTHPLLSGYNDFMGFVAKMAKELFGGATGVVRAARSQIGWPYSWGGGGKSGPSFGIAQGRNTKGYDCSGLTEYGWWKGAHTSIGGSTGPQAAGSRPSVRKPGALGFVGNPIHHVMLASDRPGMVIQAPHTGSFVQEVARGSSNWRWPRNAKMQGGGIVPSDAFLDHLLRPGIGRQLFDKYRRQGLIGDPHRNEEHRKIPALGGGGQIPPGGLAVVGERGQELVRAGGGGAAVTPVSSGEIHLHVENHGVIGSKLEVEDWLASSITKLHRSGRFPHGI